jgi:hypothetical protein
VADAEPIPSGASIAAHADWSVDPRKRWMAVARSGEGPWVLAAPEPVGDPATLLSRLSSRAGGGAVALGVDLPLGLPAGYAARYAREPDFVAFLQGLAARPDFFRVCDTLAEVSPGRPFYPRAGRAGMTRAAHAAALGIPSLGRACDAATDQRPAGAPLFWTLGANQAGKAALSAWREMLVPALLSPDPPRLWPFQGGLRALLRKGGVVLAETYPAEAMAQLGVRRHGSKRRQADRAAMAPAIRAAMRRLRVRPARSLAQALAGGFGVDAAGEDRFDCVLGALCVIAVADGVRPDHIPREPAIRNWEGWVLGQAV